MDSSAPKYHGERDLRKCMLCEKLVPRVEVAFLGHLSEEHNINTMSEYNAYCETAIALNNQHDQTSAKQDKHLTGKNSGTKACEKVDSGLEDCDSDQELASLLFNKPGLVDQISVPVGVKEYSKDLILSTSKDQLSEVNFEKLEGYVANK